MPASSPSVNPFPSTCARTASATSSGTKPAACEPTVTENAGSRRVSRPPEKSAAPQTTDDASARTSASAVTFWLGLLVVREPEEADRAGAGVRADDGAERRLELELGLRPQVAQHLLELHHLLRRVRVRDADAKARRVGRLRLQR